MSRVRPRRVPVHPAFARMLKVEAAKRDDTIIGFTEMVASRSKKKQKNKNESEDEDISFNFFGMKI